jgi:hypothetical protein
MTRAARRDDSILVIFGDDIGMTNLSCYMDGVMSYETPTSTASHPRVRRCRQGAAVVAARAALKQGGQGRRETTDCNLLRKKTIPDITVPTGRTAQAATVMEMRRLV